MPDDSDDDLLPVPDACTEWGCGRPAAEHTGWDSDGITHDFKPGEPAPKPERITASHIETTWTCTHCGADCDVWGVADEWMECGDCGKNSYLVFLISDPQPTEGTP